MRSLAPVCYSAYMNTSTAVLIGSVISAIVAMAVVTLQYSLERRRQSVADRAERLGEFLASSFAVSVGIGEIARASFEDKVRVEADVRSALEDRLNRAMTKVRLFEDEDVVAAATHLERELTRITGIARGQAWTRAEWRRQRSQLSVLTDKYETIARRKLGRQRLQEGLAYYVEEGDRGA
jgi:hypothetical protein